ncbi:ABC transporter, permease [Moorella glycerini]|uniref:Leucine/isoleucine/valine transporter permease subunit n=1 Tax=Neomoorella stamsii TaxID=1266720 RepID=A0A9X7P5B0_9FIRM|nr:MULTISPECIES: branched-chain amino acid ABC transporter permease [Moorella]PRR71302.1 leucine/isoleucine/valine transporter permease subunit [Moorella stamsii]CEP66657.1 ABC transporter, permease [Moorella glycerini]
MKRRRFHILLLILLLLVAAVPLFTESRATINLLTHIFIIAIFAMSYDILLGYTGIISFGHALFFGSGAYTIGLLLKNLGRGLEIALLGLVMAILLGLVVAFLIGTISLRVRDTYFAMMTLALGELFFIAAFKLRGLTGGEDGFSFRVPEMLQDRVVFYYLALLFLILVFYLLGLFISSPTGRVLQAIRENERRAQAIGYDVFRYKLFSTVVAGITASLAGALYGLQERFVSTSVLAVDKTLDALLMTIIGGSGTLYGAIVGSALVTIVHEWFSSLGSVHPIFERWLIIFGIVYIVVVLFFPGGLVRAFNSLGRRWRKDTRISTGVALSSEVVNVKEKESSC